MAPEIRVLQVDDDDAFRSLSAEYLERKGFDVVTAHGPAAGLDRLGDDVDCIVSDYEMPGRNGLEFLDAVRERQPDLPFILFTGKGSEEIASEAIGAGVTDYLQKSATGDQFTLLANRIERAVTERRTEHALAESERMLSTLVSNLPGIVYRCENAPEWPMEYLGGNVEEITGYEASAFLDGDLEWSDIVEEGENETLWADVQNALERGDPFETTYRIVDADGNRRWVHEQGQGVPCESETPTTIEGFISEITAQKRRERAIAEYDQLIDAIGDPVYTVDADGVFTMVNERGEKRLGYEPGELVGEHVSVLLESEDIERGTEAIRQLLERDDRTTATYEMSVRLADGTRADLENHVALLTIDGEFYGTVGVLRDLADRPTVRLRRLHEATRELMAETDTCAIAERTTRAARDVLDIPLSSVRFARDGALEMVALTADLDPPPDMGDRPPYPIDGTVPGRVYRTGERAVGDVEGIDDGLDRGPVESGAYIPLGDHGVFSIGAREPNAFDETDVQLATVLAANAEAALDRATKEAELRQERDDFAALFENIPDPTIEVVMREDRPIVQRVNPAFERTFGYEAEDVRGEDLDEYVLPDDPSKRAHATEYNSRIQAGESLHAEVRRMTSGGLRDFIVHTVPHDIGEETARGYAIYTDITEQKQRERELERQNERLDEFASVVSHDLRNPLSVARGHLELARTVEGDGAEHFEAIDGAHERMDGLINRLLAFARQGDPATAPTPVSVAEAARDAWETVETDSLALVIDGERQIRADPDRLRQLFENLFRNTVEHGERASTQTVGALANGFYVEDDGVGIPESERESVLRSGYSGGDGTGFGLSIVDAVSNTHGWALRITEADGGGARFEFHDDEE